MFKDMKGWFKALQQETKTKNSNMEHTINVIRKIQKMIISEAKRYDLKMLVTAEHRWAGERHFR